MAQFRVLRFICDGRFRVHAIHQASGPTKGKIIETFTPASVSMARPEGWRVQ